MYSLVILAAGWGSRYGGLKQVDGFGPNNENLIDYALFDAVKTGFNEVVLVIKEEMQPVLKDKFKNPYFKDLKYKYVIQSVNDIPINISINRLKPWGTAHALYVCREVLKNPFMLINADDFYGIDSYRRISHYLKNVTNTSHKFAMVGYKLGNCLSANGPVSRGICHISNNQLIDIREINSITRNINLIIDKFANKYNENDIVSMNCWGFTPYIFNYLADQFSSFLMSKIDLLASEFMLPSIIMQLINEQKCSVDVFSCDNKPFGVTYLNDKKIVKEHLLKLHENNEYPKILNA